MDIILILYSVFLGIPAAVFIIFYIKGASIEESAKQAYTVILSLILLAIAFLFISNSDIDEETKNQYVYIGLMLAFVGLILAVQGDIKGIQRHADLNLKITNIQNKIDRGIERLDRIEECLKNITYQKNSDIPKISKKIQNNIDNTASNPEKKDKKEEMEKSCRLRILKKLTTRRR